MEVDQEALQKLDTQGLLQLAEQLGILTNEVRRDNHEGLLQLIQQQMLST